MARRNELHPHTALMRACSDYLRQQGAWVLKVAGGAYQRPGVPDILACLDGRFVAVEGKTGKAVLRENQVEERDGILAAGGIWLLAHTVEDLEQGLWEERFMLRGRLT